MAPVGALDRGLGRALILACLFPYIRLLPLGTDVQPWALAISGLMFVLLVDRLRFGPVQYGTFVMALAAVMMFALEGGGFPAIRNLTGYVSLFLLSVTAAYVMRHDQAAVARLIDVALLIWFAVGLIQRLISKEALTFLISAARTTETRGVVALAAEPTFFATMAILMVLWRATIGLRAWHLIVMVVIVIGLAASSQALLIVIGAAAVAIVCLLFNKRYAWVSVATLMVGAVGAAAILNLMEDSRLGELLRIALDNPKLILLKDLSANERFAHIFAGLYTIPALHFLPNGILAQPWTDYVNWVVHSFPDLFWVPQEGDRIMSATGAVFFQMGIIALPLIVAVITAIVRWDKPASFKIIWSAAFGLTLLTALPINHPLIGALLGVLSTVGYRGSSSDRPIAGTKCQAC